MIHRMLGPLLIALILMPITTAGVHAHASEGGFVLLLPTRIYIVSGCAAVALSVVIVGLMPGRWLGWLFTPLRLAPAAAPKLQTLTSLTSTALLLGCILVGWWGPRDPVENILPLLVWTMWWVGLVTLQALLGDLWAWVNPWTGLMRLLRPGPAPFQLSARLGQGLGITTLIAFALFALVYPAPDDPARLAVVVTGYWLFTLAGMLLFGASDWLARAEFVTILLRLFADLSPFRRAERWSLGLPGWRLTSVAPPAFGLGLFVVALLGIGSFDGLNETFWWLTQIGVNPLEFPGRSAVIGRTTIGLLGSILLLALLFAACVWAGLRLADGRPVPAAKLRTAFGSLSMSLLPIAFGFHAAHFLVFFLINSQYLLVALSDPLHTGRDLLALGEHYVSTGFLKSRDPVRTIWFTQAGVIVAAHILAVFLAHHAASQIYPDRRRALISQIPLAVFMVLYTLFGLWLLATARGA